MFSAILKVCYRDEAQINIDGESLVHMVRCLADSDDVVDFLETLSQIPWESLRCEIASKQHLNAATRSILAADKHIAIARALANNFAAVNELTQEQIDSLIDTDDFDVVSSLLQYMDDEHEGFDDMLLRLSSHTDPAIRTLVADHRKASWATLERLSKDEDPGVKQAARASILSRANDLADQD